MEIKKKIINYEPTPDNWEYLCDTQNEKKKKGIHRGLGSVIDAIITKVRKQFLQQK